MDSHNPNGGMIRRPNQNYPPPERIPDLERLELKIDALRGVLGSGMADRWAEPVIDVDGDFHASKLDQYWRAIRLRKGLIILGGFLGLVAGLFFTLTRTPVYRARATLEVIGLNDNFMNAKDVDPIDTQSYMSETHIQTQADILTSSSLVGRALAEAGMDKVPAGAVQEGRAGKLLVGLGLRRPAKPPTQAQLVRGAMGSLAVTPRRGTRLIDIDYDSTNPERAAQFANSLAKVFLDYTLASRVGTSEGTAKLLNRELQGLEDKLRQAEGEMEAYARSKDIVFTNDTGTVAEEKLRHLQAELSKAQADRIAKQSQHEMAQAGSAEALPEVLDSPVLRDYQTKLADLRRELARLRSIYQPDFYPVTRIERQIADYEAQAARERGTTVERTKNEYQASLRRERYLSEALLAQSKLVSQQSADSVSYNLLKGQVETYKSLYETMLQKVKSAQVAAALRANTVRIVEPAEQPGKPYTPKVPLNCGVGLMVGLLGGLALVITKDQTDRTLKNPGDIGTHANLTELAVIPSVEADPYMRTLQNESFSLRNALKSAEGKAASLPARSPELVVWRYKPTLMAETFRGLLTSILFSSRDETSPRVLVLTSPGPSEGKSTITSNLAVAMAEVQQRVLLIDADARKPRLHTIFNLPNDKGLTSLLTSRNGTEIDAESLIARTHIPGLSILTSGPCQDNISTLLHSARLANLLRELRTNYDSILIDTAPVLQVPDARILGRRADCVILVARAGATTRDALQAARQRFHDDGVPILGAVLNEWTPKSDTSYGYYNPEYYRTNE